MFYIFINVNCDHYPQKMMLFSVSGSYSITIAAFEVILIYWSKQINILLIVENPVSKPIETFDEEISTDFPGFVLPEKNTFRHLEGKQIYQTPHLTRHALIWKRYLETCIRPIRRSHLALSVEDHWMFSLD